MPTRDPHLALGLERALDLAERSAFPAADPLDPGHRVGLEPERLVFAGGRPGSPERPLGRPPLGGPGGLLAALAAAGDRALPPPTGGLESPHIDLPQGGSLTFEPGGQVEHSTAVHPGLSAALDDCAAVDAALERAFAGPGWSQAFLGLDPWGSPETVPQQLLAPRYPAMARYFALRGPAGAWMMRLSASLQVNLDLGPGSSGAERARLGFLLSPALTAIFSTSPELPGQARRHSRRARIWQTLDPTRSGFPRRLLEAPGEPLPRAYARAALEADVLLLRDGAGGARPGRPGRRFADWIAAADPELGFPTEEDLRYHLSTLFFEVRCRGFLELRAVDALPPPWRPAAAGLIAGLLLDDQARGLALERLEPTLPELQERWWLAADLGLSLPGMAAEARFLFETARAGLSRLGTGFARREHADCLDRFEERFTARGRAPADCLREWLADAPPLALEWARAGQTCPEGQPDLAGALD